MAGEGDLVSALDDLRALLARFDDAAFEALANRGLLRRARKDLEKSTPVLVAATASVEIAVGEWNVRMDSRGPAQAECSCPSAGTCQHILAACLWVKEGVAGGGARAPAAPERESAPPLEALHAELMSFDAAALSAWSGLPAFRWALELVRDSEGEDKVAIGGERNIVVAFAHPRVEMRYVGGGLDAAILDVASQDPRKYVAAAVLAYQLAHGRALPPPPERRGGTRPLALGVDHAGSESVATHRDTLREKVLEAAGRLVVECVMTGLSHLSAAVAERFTTIAVSAQAAELHRTALLLRRLADHVEMLLNRHGGADEARMFDDLALAHTLLAALRAAGVGRGAEGPRHLVGEARSAYEHAGALELIGLGAYPWRTQSGHVGLTLVFRDGADSQWYTWSESRPEIQTGFDPVARYTGAGPWNGVGSPQQLVGQRVMLAGAHANRFGRLSAAEGTSAVLQGPADAASLERGAVAQWALLEARLRDAGGTLEEHDPRRGLAIVRPARTGKALFDPMRQELAWPLVDALGNVLPARVRHSALNAHAIARIEEWGTAAAGKAMLVRLLRERGALVAEPISILDGAAGAVDSIYFESRGRAAPSRLQRWKKALLPGATPVTVEGPPPGWTLLEALDAQSLRLAERGLMELGPHLVKGLEGELQRCSDAGFSLPRSLWTAASHSREAPQRAAALLRVRHAVRALQLALF
jgi:SWIM zinc finger